jgi:hypothetical protein
MVGANAKIAEEDRADLCLLAPIVRITVADADWLQEMLARQWRRAPTDEELVSLVADHLKEEVLARKARELQLDLGDTIVRRRLAQKMAFLLEDTAHTSEPAEVRCPAGPCRSACARLLL